MISVVLFDSDTEFVADIQKTINRRKKITVIAATRDLKELESMLIKDRVDIIIFGPSIKNEDMISLTKSVSESYPNLGIILIVPEVTTQLLQEALRCGAKDVLPSSINSKLLIQSIEMANQHTLRVRKMVEDYKQVNTKKIDTDTNNDEHTANVITFFSTKGGVGKTFISTNVAIGLVKQTQSDVILVDLDLQFGDVGVTLHLQPKCTIYDVVSNIDQLDKEMMKGFLTPHNSGLKTLLAPLLPDKADEISCKDIPQIIDVLREMCDYLIIDTPAVLNDVVLSTLDNSDTIYLVTSLDVPSLKNTKLSLNMMDLLEYPQNKIKVVLNRANSKVMLNKKDVKKSLGINSTVTIPSDIIVPRSLNKGLPVVLDTPRANVSKNINQLVNIIKNGSLASHL